MFDSGPRCHCDECEFRRQKEESNLAGLAIMAMIVLFFAYGIFTAIV